MGCLFLIWFLEYCALGRSLVKLMLGMAIGGSGLMWPNYEVKGI